MEQALLDQVDETLRKSFQYDGHAFFWHVDERYLQETMGRWTSFYLRLTPQDSFNALPALDDFLDRADGRPAKGLQHIYPQFVADYAGWWETRTTPDLGEERWLNKSFGGCPEIPLDEVTAQGFVDLDIATLSARCVDIVLSGTLPTSTPELELFVSSEDVEIDEFYLSFARATGLFGGTVSCREILDSGRVPARSMPCVLDPNQGLPVGLDTALFVADQPVRGWRFARFTGDGTAPEMRVRFMISRVLPDATLPGYDLQTLDRGKVRVAATVDVVQLQGAGVPDPDPQPNEEPIGAIVPWADGGMTTTDDASDPSDTMMTRFLAGGARIPGFDLNQIAPQLQAGGGMNLLLINEAFDRDGNGVTIGMLPEEDIPLGKVGPVGVQAIGEIRSAFGTEIGIQDLDRPSKLDIYQNTQSSLQYRGELHLCFFTGDQLLAAIQREDQGTPCDWGSRRESYFTDTTVSLPEALPGVSRRGAGFRAIPPSPEFEQLKNIRLDRIGQALGAYPDPSDTDPVLLVGQAAPSRPGAPAQVNQVDGEAAPDSCNCSCEAKRQSDRQRLLGTMDAAAQRCRLLCGAAWQQCTP